MDVSLDRKTDLITDGLFARVRHPIYAFSILLMLCSAAIVPTAPMLVVAARAHRAHELKARNEERHLPASTATPTRGTCAGRAASFPRRPAPTRAPSAR